MKAIFYTKIYDNNQVIKLKKHIVDIISCDTYTGKKRYDIMFENGTIASFINEEELEFIEE